MKGTEAIAKALQAEGVEILTCFPLNQIIDAASAIGIRPIVTRTERVAVNIADGYSRMTGGRKIGVSAVQYGPGAENAFGGVAQAFADNSPVLCLSGAYERSRLSIPPNFKAGRIFQARDQMVRNRYGCKRHTPNNAAGVCTPAVGKTRPGAPGISK